MANFNFDVDLQYENGDKQYDAFSRRFYHENGRKLFDGSSGECFYDTGKKAYDEMWGDIFYDNGHKIFDRFWNAVNKYNGSRIDRLRLTGSVDLAPNVKMNYNDDEDIRYHVQLSDNEKTYFTYWRTESVAKFELFIRGQCVLSKAKYI